MLLYWSQPLALKETEDMCPSSIVEAVKDMYIPETYFVYNFIVNMGYTPKYTVADSWDIYRQLYWVWDFKHWNYVWYKRPEAFIRESALFRWLNRRICFKKITESEFKKSIDSGRIKYDKRIDVNSLFYTEKVNFILNEKWQ